MAHRRRRASAIATRRDRWNVGLLRASARWAERGARCTGWTDRGVERCRGWAHEGAQRPGELAPPSWFAIALPFGIAWYRMAGGAARVWCWVARRSCRDLARAVHGRAVRPSHPR